MVVVVMIVIIVMAVMAVVAVVAVVAGGAIEVDLDDIVVERDHLKEDLRKDLE
jgi:hypothetical protein